MTELQVYRDIEQGTPEWLALRAGIPTASRFADVMAKGRGKSPSLTRRRYMLTLIGERLTGNIEDGYSNAHMERGTLLEPEARQLYELVTDNHVQQVGFIRRGNVGASPDGLVGDEGMIEIKCKIAHRHLDALLDNEMPSEHVAQVQGQLWVSGRGWCDFMSYCPGLPPLILRVERDEKRIAEIKIAVEEFNEELEHTMKKIQERAI